MGTSDQDITDSDAARYLGISIEDVHLLESQEILHPVKNEQQVSLYSTQELERIRSSSGLTISEEAAQVNAQLQREISVSLLFVRRSVLLAGGGFLGYILLVILFATSFSLFPVQTANWLGYIPKSPASVSLIPEDPESNVLAAATVSKTNLESQKTPSTIRQTIFQPVSRVSLGLVKSLNPGAYAQVAKVTILDPNDVLVLDNDGVLVPIVPLKVPESSYLQIADPGLVANLNSQFLQGKQPGTNVGDLAVVGEVTVPTQTPEPALIQPRPTLITTNAPISGLSNTNLSGSAGITNANLANSGVTIDTSGPLSGGGAVSLGGILTLTCPTCKTSLSGITAADLTAGDFSSKITSGTYSIDITGSVASATDFTGSLSGDVTGTQGSTTVAGINGATLGTTTATSGNILIGSGTQWVTRALSSDATIDSTGVLTLKNTGTPNTYGSALNIPVLTTDAQGRVTSVTNTAIAGLTTSNFTSANVSQWTNNSGFVTASTTDTLTSKTIAATSNTISDLTNTNFSGSAGITNANLANSSVTVTAGTGLSGGGAVALGGSVILTNAGVTSLTGTTNQVNVSASTGAITLTLPQNIHSGASPTFAGLTLSNLVNCGTLATDSSGVVICDSATGDTATFSDINPATIADNNTTELFNDLIKPSITPNIATQTILVTVHMRFTGGGGADTYPAIRIVRNNGLAATCLSPQVGDTFATFMTSTDTADATATFLDYPATTGQVFYTVCSSAASNLGSTPVSNRIDITLVELGADLAENYYTTDDSIGPGDVVAIDSSLPAGVKKSNQQHDDQVIGIVSTSPKMILDDAIGLNFGRAVPVALAGRVPIKVSTQNGSIKIGDFLTSSTTAGVAMKATKPGSVLGIAMGTYEGSGVGVVMSFVNKFYFDGKVSAEKEVASGSAEPFNANYPTEETVLDQITKVVSGAFKNMAEFFGHVIFHADVIFLGRPTFNKDTAGHAVIKTGESEVSVNFEKEYISNPVVTVNVNLVGEARVVETPSYAVYDLSAKGFKIKISRVAASDLNFSWIALAVSGENLSTSTVSSTATPSVAPSPAVISPSPSQEATPSANPIPVPDNSPTPEASSSVKSTP